MKKTMLKRVFAAFMATAMIFGVSACKKEETKPNTNEGAVVEQQDDKTNAALTEDEYMDTFQTTFTSLGDMQTKMAEIDMTDETAAKSFLEEIKTPFAEFAAVTPPEKYAEAHGKIQSGCEAMVAYIDGMSALIGETDQTKIQEEAAKLTGDVQTAMNDFAEGAQMLQTAE